MGDSQKVRCGLKKDNVRTTLKMTFSFLKILTAQRATFDNFKPEI